MGVGPVRRADFLFRRETDSLGEPDPNNRTVEGP